MVLYLPPPPELAARALMHRRSARADGVHVVEPARAESIRLVFARVAEHEAEHWIGRSHADMHERVYRCQQDVSGWLGDLPLRPAATSAPKTPEQLSAARDARVLANGKRLEAKVAEWDRKLALAKTKRTAWATKLSSWERRNEQRIAAGRSGRDAAEEDR
jgi:hypothetical protein